jgi:hypothetical protein
MSSHKKQFFGFLLCYALNVHASQEATHRRSNQVMMLIPDIQSIIYGYYGDMMIEKRIFFPRGTIQSISPDGKYMISTEPIASGNLFTMSVDTEIHIHDIEKEKHIRTFRFPYGLDTTDKISFLSDSQRFLITKKNEIWCYWIDRELAEVTIITDNAQVATSCDGKYIAVASKSTADSIDLYNTHDKRIHKIQPNAMLAINQLAFSLDGTYLAMTDNKHIAICDVVTQNKKYQFRYSSDKSPIKLNFLPASDKLVAQNTKMALVYDLSEDKKNQNENESLKGHDLISGLHNRYTACIKSDTSMTLDRSSWNVYFFNEQLQSLSHNLESLLVAEHRQPISLNPNIMVKPLHNDRFFVMCSYYLLQPDHHFTAEKQEQQRAFIITSSHRALQAVQEKLAESTCCIL